MKQITVRDETFSGKVLNQISLELTTEITTVKDLIAARVQAEVAAYNNRLPEYYRGLIQPSGAEETLNGYRFKKSRTIDAEQQVYTALEAFTKNGFFVIVDEQQVESLEQEVILRPDTSVAFLKLTPLVGG